MLKKLVCLCFAVIMGHGGLAIAQEGDPNAILDASRAAIAESTGFTAQFKMFGDGQKSIKSMMPSMEGQLVFGQHPTFGDTVHVTGKARDKAEGAPYSIDLLRSDAAIAWIDHKDQTINEHPANSKLRTIPTAVKLVMFDMLIKDDPYGDRMDTAESITLEEQQEVGGELCDVVFVRYAKVASSGRTRGVRSNHAAARWFISTTDHLPRRVEHVTDGGILNFSMVTELTNLVAQDPTDEQIDILRIPTYTLKSTLNEKKPEEAPETTPDVDTPIDTTGNATPTTPSIPVGPTLKRAPVFEFADASGAKINNASQRDRVTVMYFNGSWSLACRETSPMVSDLASAFASANVDVFGIAVRERDADAVRSAFEQAEYTHRLVVGSDELAQKFGVLLYPTIVVINQVGEIAFEGHMSKEFDARKLVEGAGLAIKESSAG